MINLGLKPFFSSPEIRSYVNVYCECHDSLQNFIAIYSNVYIFGQCMNVVLKFILQVNWCHVILLWICVILSDFDFRTIVVLVTVKVNIAVNEMCFLLHLLTPLFTNHHSFCSHRMLLKTILFPIHKIRSLYVCSLWLTDIVFWVQNGFLFEGRWVQTSDAATHFTVGCLYPLKATFLPKSVFLGLICFSTFCKSMNWWLTCNLEIQSTFVSLFGAKRVFERILIVLAFLFKLSCGQIWCYIENL
jgi:hypothetical protein